MGAWLSDEGKLVNLTSLCLSFSFLAEDLVLKERYLDIVYQCLGRFGGLCVKIFNV